MPVLFYSKGKKTSTPQKQKLLHRLQLLSHIEEKQLGDISIIYTSDKELLAINKKYLHHDFYTDIITFDYSDKNKLAGDLFISIDRVKENAEELGVPYPTELHRVVIHGVLHLAGYKDKQKKDISKIRKKEEFYLSSI
jgi:probable rRNA maturation factor